MAKLKSLNLEERRIPCPSVDGLFMRNVSFVGIQEIEKQFKKFAEGGKEKELDKNSLEDVAELLAWLFNNLLVDENGELFEDALTSEDVMANLPVGVGIALMRDVRVVVTGGSDSLGND